MEDRPGDPVSSARGYAELFDLVKPMVEARLSRSRSGLMLGLQRLGLAPDRFLGGYFVSGSNALVLNRDVLDHIQAAHPGFLNAYAFHVMLHEYLHALGFHQEGQVRRLAYEISREELGEEHPATLIAAAMAPGVQASGAPELFSSLVYPPFGWRPPGAGPIEILRGFDLDASPYIA